jgi:hypothetical protein
VSASSVRSGAAREALANRLAALDAMALLARQTGLVVHVVVPRGPGVVEHACEVGRMLGVVASADLMASSIRVRFAAAESAGVS